MTFFRSFQTITSRLSEEVVEAPFNHTFLASLALPALLGNVDLREKSGRGSQLAAAAAAAGGWKIK